VRKADRPVLLVRDELAVPPARVLLPTSLSGRAGEILTESLAFLERMEGGREAELEALFIAAEVEGRPARGQNVPDPARAMAARRLDEFLAGAPGAAKWQIGSRVEFGFIDREILKRIESWRPDLVVLRTHDRKEAEPFLLGRVTMALLRQGSASVLVVPPAAARVGRIDRQVETVSVAA
jgi:nucleotide-binding universal stress UspA family protein